MVTIGDDQNIELQESDILFGFDDGTSSESSECLEELDDCVSPPQTPIANIRTLPKLDIKTDARKNTHYDPQSSSKSAPIRSYLKNRSPQHNRENQWRVKYVRTLIGPDKLASRPKEVVPKVSLSNPIDIPWKPLDRTLQFDGNSKLKEESNNSFIPPHQLVHRACFSLGMQHHFRHKPGKI